MIGHRLAKAGVEGSSPFPRSVKRPVSFLKGAGRCRIQHFFTPVVFATVGDGARGE